MLTKIPSQPTFDQPSKFTLSKQRPVLARTEEVDKDITTLDPSLDRKKLTRGDTNVAMTKRATTSGQPLFKPEKESMRDQFRRNAAEKEKRRRQEHRQRQQLIIQAKIEQKEESVEGITSDVIDMDLNNNQDANVVPTEQPQPPILTNDMDDLPMEITAAAASASEKAVNESNLAPHWINARADGDDMWGRASKKKGSTTSPSATRRKITAKKLDEVRPQLYQFDASQWVEAMKGGRY